MAEQIDASKINGPKVFAKVSLRLVPFLILMYLVAFIDRANVGFAALSMNRDLGFTAEIFGLGSGLFFLGYFIFQVPSNLIMERVGARVWIASIMVTWGALSMCTAFVEGPKSFYALRFVLGLAESGLYPGVILFLTYWFPAATRGRFTALFLIAVPASNVVGAPLSGWLLGFSTEALKNWQVLFLLEGIPAVVMGILTWCLLPDRPSHAGWLSRGEKSYIAKSLAQDPPGDIHDLRAVFFDKRVWLLIIPGFFILTSLYGLTLWLPQVVHAMGFTALQTGFIVAAPYLASMVAMVLVGISSDRHRERTMHIVVCALAGAAGMVGGVTFSNALVAVLFFTLAACGIHAAVAVYWSLPPTLLRGTAAAGGIALINSFNNLSGFAGPYLIGAIRQHTGSFFLSFYILAGLLCFAATATFFIGRAFFDKREILATV